MKIYTIKNEEQYKKYLKRMNEIFCAEEGTPEEKELLQLADVLEIYEKDNYPIED